MKLAIFALCLSIAMVHPTVPLIAKTRQPPKGLQESSKPKPPPAPPLSCGAWFEPGDTICSLPNGAAILFRRSELPSAISCKEGVFTLPNRGVYQITFGVTTNSAAQPFELQISGKPIPGGKLSTLYDGTLSYGTGALTVMVSVNAKETLRIVNLSGSTAMIGTGEKGTAAAYISIQQIR